MKKTLFFSFLSLIYCISSYSSEEISYLNGNSTNLQQTSLNGEAKALAAWNKLIVYIVKGYNEKTPQLLSSDPIFVTKECDYSYNELLKAANEVSEFMVSEKNAENLIRDKLSLCSLII